MKNMTQINTVGIDLAKNVIQIFAADKEGQRVMNRRFSRNKAMECFEKIPPSVISMEACSSSHNWVRSLTRMGTKFELCRYDRVCSIVYADRFRCRAHFRGRSTGQTPCSDSDPNIEMT